MSAASAPLQQSELHQPLGDHPHRRLVRVVPVIAGAHARDGRAVRLQHHLVNRALLGREAAVDGQRAGDVGGVALELAAGVHQQQVAVVERLVVVAVMQDAAVRAAADDRVIGGVGVVTPELVQQLGHHLVLGGARAAEAHDALMRLRGDARAGAQQLELAPRLVEAHVVQHVIERHELLRRVAAVARLGAQAVDPAHHALVEVRVHAHGVVHPGAVLEQSRQDLVDVGDRKGIVGAVVARRPGGPGAAAVPGLARPDRARARTGCTRPGLRPGTSTATASGSPKPVR